MRRFVTAIATVLLLLAGAPSAGADADPSPAPTGGVDCGMIVCNIDVGTGGSDGGTAPIDDPGGDGENATCIYNHEEIPCTSYAGVWDGDCYVKASDPQPPKSDSIWRGNDDGLIVECTSYLCIVQPDQDYVPMCPVLVIQWAPELPGEADPAELAQQAVSQMHLQGIDIGIVPEEGPDRVGIVGMPQWMWVNEPTPRTFGPIEASATAGDFTVTATAQVDRIVWDMGDGTTVECVGPGTPYEDRFDIMDSPDCGHRYTEQGEYEVTATSYWTVQWEGIGQTGTIPLERTSTANIVMGEAQVITQ